MDLFSNLTSSPTLNLIIQGAALLLAAVILWYLLRFVFKVAVKVFWIGCGGILMLGLLYLLARFLGLFS